MSGFLRKFFGLQDDVNFESLIEDGAVIVDVRSEEEYLSFHINDSIHIPLDVLSQKYNDLTKEQTYILVCHSGIRSKSGADLLKRNGFKSVYNGGAISNFSYLNQSK